MAKRVKSLDSIRNRIVGFREMREQLKDLEAAVKETQPELIAAMRNVDPLNTGIVFDESDKSKGTAYVQQNERSEVWDEDGILDYIKSKSALKKNVTTQVLDIRKWEAEVAAGNVPAAVAKSLKHKQPPTNPFIRFGKRGSDSK